MELANHREEIPFSHYTGLFRQMDPRQTATRLPFVGFDGEKFTVKLLGREYRISWPEYAIEAADGRLPEKPVQIFLLRCLLEAGNEPWHGEWKTFRQMPWGELYFRPYSGRVLKRAAFAFGANVAAFREASEKLGGTPVNHGDAGFRFDFFGPYQMQIIVWEGDDEFPPSAQILYTDNFAAVSAEDRVVAGDILISHIRSAMQ